MKILIAVIPLLAGFLLDCLLGDPYSLPHPIRLIGRLISSLEKWVRCRFSSRLVLGGVVMSIIVLLTSSLIPLGFLMLCYKLNVWLGVVLESVLCYYMLAARCLRNESMKVYKAIVENDTEKARKAVSMIVGRDTKPLDRNGIIRAAVETVAENTSDGVTAPMLFMGLGGAPLGFFYKAANTMDSMIGYTSEKYLHIGRFAAKLDDVLNYIPSRLTALLMILSAGILKLDTRNAWKYGAATAENMRVQTPRRPRRYAPVRSACGLPGTPGISENFTASRSSGTTFAKLKTRISGAQIG